MTAPSPPTPLQPLIRTQKQGVFFKPNAQAQALVEAYPGGIEALLGDERFSAEDKCQTLQLLGWTLADVQSKGFLTDLDVPQTLPNQAKSVPHPIQPLDLDHQGVIRFRCNRLIDFLATGGGSLDMNKLTMLGHPAKEREHLAQLIGYSHSGAGSLSYMSDHVLDTAWEEWETRAQRHAKAMSEMLDSRLPESPKHSTAPRF